MKIVSRGSWGASPWNGQPYPVNMSERTHFLVHYHGGEPRHDRGKEMAKEVESIHLRNGWSGVGYNFLVGQDGVAYEGRGWNRVGAHCPGKNRDGIGVYVAVGGNQKPSLAALKTVRAIYNEANRRSGRTLYKSYHGAHYPTSCAGVNLIGWVKGGMKVSGYIAPVSQEAPAPRPEPGKLVIDGVRGPATYKALQEAIGANVDGQWGPETRRKLQSFLGVNVDGIIGTNSVKALQAAVGAKQDGVWGRGTTKALQRALSENTFKRAKSSGRKSSGGDLKVDGLMGPATVKAIQKWVGVKQDGIMGNRTEKALQRKLDVKADGYFETNSIKALQRKVDANVDGVWGSGTTRKLQQFLNKHVL